ncbi:PTS sugar transporter subunit IIA [Enterococcus avium]|uniref:PTS sugar transporter subunit IIA n=1 Tax=Enterococcus avium TaxID=33945 RepID=UPI00233039EC|nr:PTS sugar transporter subunit IIA [Enterococcus avium]MDB1750238.1 PTS sugar transporter subunit IIA [Enterococcus avium]MDB1754348.1 PTS sugar transporter subunit IIA [Enterococcus avium]MDB1761420.1 PTS sugar transporter subunit IIA [Enterococcus avium]
MLKEQLKGKTMFIDTIESWQEAIRMGAEPLVNNGIVEKAYVEAIIQNVLENGNYVILLPQVAMPHARPEYGSKGVGLTFLHVKEPVMFPDEEPVKIFFTLSSDSPEGHLDLIASLGELLSDEELYEKLFDVETEAELLDLVKE